jgi:DNA-binding transcriptional ArsR family regulator
MVWGMATVDSAGRASAAKLLSHPLRAQVYALLRADEASPLDLSERIGAPLPNVSYHVRVLLKAGLVEQTRTKQVRGALQHFYEAVVDVPCEALNVRLGADDAAELARRIRGLVAEYEEDWSGEVVSVMVHTGPLN